MADNDKIFEVHRLAQAAQEKAMVADHKADTALLSQAAHEKLCAERYNHIDKQLTKIEKAQSDSSTAHHVAVEKIYIVLNELRTSDGYAKGGRSTADHIFRYICLGVGALIAIFGVTR